MKNEYQTLYETKRGTVQECLDVIRSGDVVALPRLPARRMLFCAKCTPSRPGSPVSGASRVTRENTRLSPCRV